MNAHDYALVLSEHGLRDIPSTDRLGELFDRPPAARQKAAIRRALKKIWGDA